MRPELPSEVPDVNGQRIRVDPTVLEHIEVPVVGGSFLLPDVNGQRIRVDPTVLEHIEARHPEIAGFLNRIQEAVREPDFVYFRPRTHVYLRYNDLGEGEVRTVYPTNQPARGDTLVHVRPRRGP